MNLPNKLTILRVIMVPFFVFFLVVPLNISPYIVRPVSAVLFALAALTDMIDGKLARKYNLVTDFGKIMDPLADKFMTFAAMIGILVYEEGLFRNIFVWAALTVIFRELAVTSIRLIAAGKDGRVIAAKWLGKVKTTTQIICVVTVLLEPVILPFEFFTIYRPLSYITTLAMTVMTLWSGADYMYSFRDYFKS